MSDYYASAEAVLPLWAARKTDPPGPLFAAPAQRHSPTSVAAAEAITPDVANACQRRVLAFLEEHGPATDEEIAAGLAMNPSTARPRRIELARRGLVVEAGMRRTNSGRMATVWRRA